MTVPIRDIVALASLFREMVVAREDVAVAEIIVAYQQIYDAATVQLDDLMAYVAAQIASGRDPSPSWADRIDRLSDIVDMVEREVATIAGRADVLITSGQADLVNMAQDHAEQLTLAGMGTPPPGATVTFGRLNAGAVETMVGFLTPGTPLRDALDRLPGMASEDVRKALVEGIGLGRHPRRVARDFQMALGGNLASAERLARTAQLSAYRESSLATYRENRDIVIGWRWVADIGSSRTCLSCLAKHGQTFDLSESFRDHWNGRCAAVPATKSWEELGFENVPDTRPVIEPGEDWFNRQPAFTQRRLMGRSKYHAWKAGEVTFSDFSVAHDDPIFGQMFSEASLKELLGTRRAREWYARSAAIERGEFDIDLPLAAD